MPGYTNSYTRHEPELTASQLGLSAVDLSASTDSNAFDTSGFNQMTVYYNLSTRTAATNIVHNLVYIDTDDNEYVVQLAADDGAGTDTGYDHSIEKTVSGVKLWVRNFPISAQKMKITNLTGTNATTDVMSVRVVLGVL